MMLLRLFFIGAPISKCHPVPSQYFSFIGVLANYPRDPTLVRYGGGDLDRLHSELCGVRSIQRSMFHRLVRRDSNRDRSS